MKDPQKPVLETDPMVALLIGVGRVLEGLKETTYVRLNRPDLGFRISGYYNYPSQIRLDIGRIDKEPFFSDTPH